MGLGAGHQQLKISKARRTVTLIFIPNPLNCELYLDFRNGDTYHHTSIILLGLPASDSTLLGEWYLDLEEIEATFRTGP